MTTRRYTQHARAEAADETRRRILDAMRERLRAAPSVVLSIERVAQEAGVARSTVYVVFGSKAGLFEALGQDLLDRTGFQRIVDAVALPDAREAVRASLRAAARVYAAERDVSRTIYSMESLEPQARCAAPSTSSSAAAPRGNADWRSGSPQRGSSART